MSTPKTMYLVDEWHVTRARANDHHLILELLAQVFPEKCFTVGFFLAMDQVWVAKDENGNAIGTSSARLCGQGRGELHWIAVRSDHRRQHLAAELCRRAIAWMLDRGVRWVTVKQNPPTEAGTALYTSLGFKDPTDGHQTFPVPTPPAAPAQ